MMLDVSKNDFSDAREIFDVLLRVHFVHSVDLSNSLTTVRDSLLAQVIKANRGLNCLDIRGCAVKVTPVIAKAL